MIAKSFIYFFIETLNYNIMIPVKPYLAIFGKILLIFYTHTRYNNCIMVSLWPQLPYNAEFEKNKIAH